MPGWTLFTPETVAPQPESMTMTFDADEFLQLIVTGIGELIPDGYVLTDMRGIDNPRLTNLDETKTARIILILDKEPEGPEKRPEEEKPF